MGIPRKGIIVPLVTPFTEDKDVDFLGFRRNLEWLLTKAIHGVVVLPTAGEAPSLTLEERRRLVSTTSEVVAGRTPVIVGVGGLNVRETEVLIKHSEAEGVDGLFVITPYFYRLTPAEFLSYYTMVARRTQLDLMIYNSTYAGVPLTADLLEELVAEPNFVALKEGNQLQLGEIVRRLGGRISVFTSRDVFIFETLALGGHGAIAFSANVVPDLVLALFEAAEAGKFETARRLQFELDPLIWKLVSRSYPAPVKAAMDLVGLTGGAVRPPLTRLNSDEIEGLKRVLHSVLQVSAMVNAPHAGERERVG